MRKACSVSTQNTIVFWKRSPLSFRNSVTLLRDSLGPLVDDQLAVEILLVVDAVFDLVAVLVRLPLFRAITLDIDVEMNLDDLVRREEAVSDALL